MNETVLKVAAYPLSPYTEIKIVDMNLISGCLGDIWMLVADDLHMKWKLTILEKITKPNTIALDFDIILQASTHLSRQTSIAFATSWYSLFTSEPQKLLSTSFYKTWPVDLWFPLMFMIFLFSTMLCGAMRQILSMQTHLKNFKMFENEGSFINCLLTTIAILCNQGFYISSRFYSIRVLLLSLLYFGVVIYTAYSALLTSKLTSGERSFREIYIDWKDWTYCIRKDSSVYDFISNYQKYHSLVNRQPCPDGIITNDNLCKSNVILVEAPEIFLKYKQSCNVEHLGRIQSNFAQSFSLGLQFGTLLNLTVKRQIITKIVKLHETGITSRFTNKWLRKDIKITNAIRKNQPVTFRHVKDNLLIFLSLISFSFIILIFEIIFSYLKKRKDFRFATYTLTMN